MKKAMQLKAILWIEGEDDPAHDFASSTIDAVKKLLSPATKGTPPLKITVKKIEEYSSDDEDDETEQDTRLKAT